MPTNLRSALNDLASNFTDALLAALRSASLDELLAEQGNAPRGRSLGQPRGTTTKSAPSASRESAPTRSRTSRLTKGGRLARRSPDDIAKALATVVTLVKSSKGGLRSEQIREALKLDKRELPRVLYEGLRTKKLKSKGQKRATTYSAP